MSNQLTMTLNKKTYKAPKPKVKLWRKIAKFQQANDDKDLNEILDDVLGLVSDIFKHPEVTPESIEEHLDLEELMPNFTKAVEWVNEVVNGKVAQLPNQATPAAD